MKTILRIGTEDSISSRLQAEKLKNKLQTLHIDSEVIIIHTPADIDLKMYVSKKYPVSESVLATDSIDIVVDSLVNIPVRQSSEWVICGLSEREDPSECILIFPDAFDPIADLRIKAGSKIAVSTPLRKLQLLSLNPTIDTVSISDNISEGIEKIKNREIDAIVLSKAKLILRDPDLNDFQIISLHPREFVPEPGQGVTAYQCLREDLRTRSIIQKLHHPETARCTNVERSLLKMPDTEKEFTIGGYCVQDAKGYFHAYAALGKEQTGNLWTTAVSQSTTLNLAEKLFQLLNQKIKHVPGI